MTEIILPFPPSELSPNRRLHWAQLAKAKKQYRQACWAVTKAKPIQPFNDGKLRLELVFYLPNRRSIDRDNLLARMKSGIDGMADALIVNDKRFDPITVSVADEVGGYVVVRIFDYQECL